MTRIRADLLGDGIDSGLNVLRNAHEFLSEHVIYACVSAAYRGNRGWNNRRVGHADVGSPVHLQRGGNNAAEVPPGHGTGAHDVRTGLENISEGHVYLSGTLTANACLM